MSLKAIRVRLQKLADPAQAAALQRFFKTGPGEYGEGDVFLGIKVPITRKLVRECDGLKPSDVLRMLRSKFHEERLLALLCFVRAYERGNEERQAQIYDLYLNSTAYINNWDLVDLSAPDIVGAHLFKRDRKPLYRLVRSKSLWERRIAVLATQHFISKGQFADTLKLAEILLADEYDLIHKAVGWMLREVGKRDRPQLEQFLTKHCRQMPRTMLRYAIERFPQRLRQRYLRGSIGAGR